MCGGESSENKVYLNQVSHFHNHPDAQGGRDPDRERRGCPNEFLTAFSPTNPAIVYCEACYNIEVV